MPDGDPASAAVWRELRGVLDEELGRLAQKYRVPLVLHYLEDWTAPLAELRRVLRPGGRLIMAVDHPFLSDEPRADYFATRKFSCEWTLGGRAAPMTSGTP